MFKLRRRQMKHVEIVTGEWLLFERFRPGLSAEERALAIATARYVRVLMSRLHISAPQLKKITIATSVPDRYAARITQDLALHAVSSILPNVKEISIVRRIDPIRDYCLKAPIKRTTLLTFKKNKVNGDWENLFGPDPRRVRQLEEQMDMDTCTAVALDSLPMERY